MKYSKDDVAFILAEVLDVDLEIVQSIGLNDSLSQYGLDSIRAIKLIILLEEKYAFELCDDHLAFPNYDTLNKLYTLLNSYTVDII